MEIAMFISIVILLIAIPISYRTGYSNGFESGKIEQKHIDARKFGPGSYDESDGLAHTTKYKNMELL